MTKPFHGWELQASAWSCLPGLFRVGLELRTLERACVQCSEATENLTLLAMLQSYKLACWIMFGLQRMCSRKLFHGRCRETRNTLVFT